ncbi:unnamed protein product [Camellia sinensis]
MASSGSSSSPWQVLVLVANHLDPKTLDIASCVSKSWFISMSTDHLWQPICSTHFPSLSTLHFADSTVPYHRLYSLGRISAKRRLQKPRKPHLSLNNLMFTIDVVHNNNSRVFTVLKLGAELKTDPNGMFRFDIDVDGEKMLVGDDDLGGLRLVWNVVLEGYKGVFTMMECRGRGSDGWWFFFSKEFPSPGCCSGVGKSGLVADLRLGLGGKGESAGAGAGKMVVEKVGVGVLSIVSWRYVSVDDALREHDYGIRHQQRRTVKENGEGDGKDRLEELPPPGCCSGVGTSELVADLRLGLGGKGESGGRKMVVEKVGLGVLSIVSWRYVSVDDALRTA